MKNERLKTLRARMQEENLDAYLVKHLPNVRYMTGYTGSNGLCYVTMDDAWFFTDFRYKTQSAKQVKNMTIIVPNGGDLLSGLKKEQFVQSGVKVGIEGDRITYADFQKLNFLFPKTEFMDVSMMIEDIASIKDADEMALLKEAIRITDKGFTEILNDIKPGVTEQAIGAKLSYVMKMFGSEEDSFAAIIASGVNGASPHHGVSDKAVETGDFITMDFGAVYGGYHADMTRTVCLGKADERQKEIYQIVLDAQLMGIAAVKPNVTGASVDKVARDYIASKGFGDYFGHGLGHGIGLEIHMDPRLSQGYKKNILLDQVVTVEPGIYIPNWGGIRIEDDVLITETGCVVLNQSIKDLVEL